MNGDLLDIVLLGAGLLFAISGYRQGFVVGVLSFVGFLGGGVLGAQLASPIAHRFASGFSEPLVGILVVFAFASVGQLLATSLGSAVRRQLTWRPARLFDSAAGAVVSLVSVLLVAWLIGTAVVSSPFRGLATQVRHSTVLTAVDAIVPTSARSLFSSFLRLVNAQNFPQVFNGLGAPQVAPIAPPDPAVVNSRAATVAREGVLKVVGVARDCSRRVEGTGFVYAPERVMTNAHVVAGVAAPDVQVGTRTLRARVVLFDPDRDVAVLLVPGLDRPPLSFAGAATAGDSAVVVGYPQDGPFTAVAARVRAQQSARGPDIYQRKTVTREVYALRALVRPGNSGGPMLAPDGRVYGVVFAAAADDSDTGYALTAAEVAGDARAGEGATGRVDTQGCD